MKRQYLGCVGKVANGINTVHLTYAREGTGHALIGAREWIPAGHIGDLVTSAAMGLPADLAFCTLAFHYCYLPEPASIAVAADPRRRTALAG